MKELGGETFLTKERTLCYMKKCQKFSNSCGKRRPHHKEQIPLYLLQMEIVLLKSTAVSGAVAVSPDSISATLWELSKKIPHARAPPQINKFDLLSTRLSIRIAYNFSGYVMTKVESTDSE